MTERRQELIEELTAMVTRTFGAQRAERDSESVRTLADAILRMERLPLHDNAPFDHSDDT